MLTLFQYQRRPYREADKVCNFSPMHFKIIICWAFVSLLSIANIWAGTPIEQAQALWLQRHQGAQEGQADPARARQIVAAYQQAVQVDTMDAECAAGLLRAHFFLSYFADSARTDRKDAVRKGLRDSDIAVRRHPSHAGVLAWSSMLWARYAELEGIVNVARKGAADKIRNLALASYKIDPNYEQGSALRMLGVVHAEAPYIPLLLTWPSTKKADKYFREAMQKGPRNSLNAYMYGDYLARVNRVEEARAQYEKALASPVNPVNLTEETLFRNRVRERLTVMK